jgi:hypothetical protein
MDCGHYVNRSHMATRFDEQNCNGQCRACNRFDEGNNIGYTRGLIAKYGPQVIDLLYLKKHAIKKWDTFELEALIAHYKREITKLEYKLNK